MCSCSYEALGDLQMRIGDTGKAQGHDEKSLAACARSWWSWTRPNTDFRRGVEPQLPKARGSPAATGGHG